MTADKNDLAERVRQAFDAVREGDLGPVSRLQEAGTLLLPFLASYLSDGNEDVRREAISLTTVVGSAAAVPLLARVLTDPVAELRERAALAIYEKFEPRAIATNDALGKALAASVTQGNPSAAAALLLAYVPGSVAEKCLHAERDRMPPAAVRLYSWSAPVDGSLAAQVALAHRGDSAAVQFLSQKLHHAIPAEIEFLLATLREIESPPLLRALAETLNDTRAAATVQHSSRGSARRLCDVAVNAFVQRFALPVGFELSLTLSYTPRQIDEVRRGVEVSLGHK